MYNKNDQKLIIIKTIKYKFYINLLVIRNWFSINNYLQFIYVLNYCLFIILERTFKKRLNIIIFYFIIFVICEIY